MNNLHHFIHKNDPLKNQDSRSLTTTQSIIFLRIYKYNYHEFKENKFYHQNAQNNLTQILYFL